MRLKDNGLLAKPTHDHIIRYVHTTHAARLRVGVP